jgi:hypothetical protein
MKNEGLWLVAGVVVLWWIMKNGNGYGFNPTQASTALTAGQTTPVSGPYSGQVGPTVSGTFHW